MDETLLHKVGPEDSNQEAEIYVDVPTEDSSTSYKVIFTYLTMKLQSLTPL